MGLIAFLSQPLGKFGALSNDKDRSLEVGIVVPSEYPWVPPFYPFDIEVAGCIVKGFRARFKAIRVFTPLRRG